MFMQTMSSYPPGPDYRFQRDCGNSNDVPQSYALPYSSNQMQNLPPDTSYMPRPMLSPYNPQYQASYRPMHQFSSMQSGIEPCYPMSNMYMPEQSPQKTCSPWGTLAMPTSMKQDLPTEVTKQAEVILPAKPAERECKLKKKDSADHSLRFLTASIQGAKHWSKYKDKTPFLFELFGVLNSAITTGRNGYGCTKDFMLKDDKDSIQCVFYQIDRPLPKMVRGLWYRCVGRVSPQDSNGQQFNCVSVRLVTDIEKKMYKVEITASDRAMREWTKKAKEM